MADYEKWLVMARASFATGVLAKDSGDNRSAVSRYYYAAYQAITGLLLYRGLTPPANREAWSHDETPDIVVNDLSPLIRARDTCNDLRVRLIGLYNLRVTADYKARLVIEDEDVKEARKDAGFILHRVAQVLPKENTQ